MRIHHCGYTIEADAVPAEDETTWVPRTVVSWRAPDGRLRQWLRLAQEGALF